MTRQIAYIFITLFFFSCHSTKSRIVKYPKSPDYLVTGYYHISKDSDKYQRQLYGTTLKYNLIPTPIITVENFTNVAVDKNNFGNYYIHIGLDESGGQKWSEETAKSIGDSLAIIVNNELIQVALVMSQITSPVTAINPRDLTKSQAEKYLLDIKAKMRN